MHMSFVQGQDSVMVRIRGWLNVAGTEIEDWKDLGWPCLAGIQFHFKLGSSHRGSKGSSTVFDNIIALVVSNYLYESFVCRIAYVSICSTKQYFWRKKSGWMSNYHYHLGVNVVYHLWQLFLWAWPIIISHTKWAKTLLGFLDKNIQPSKADTKLGKERLATHVG